MRSSTVVEMNGHDPRCGLSIRRPIAAFVVLTGCADPCFDDGLGQGGCPEQSTEATGAATAPTSRGDATGGGGVVDETGGGAGGGEGMGCPELDEILLPQTPTVQLVVDRSGSMDNDFDGGNSRWDVMQDTLIGPSGVVSALQSTIRFGLSLYSNSSGVRCPNVNSLAPQLDAADEIEALLSDEEPRGDTPTGEAIAQITTEFLADTWEGDKIIVLATDGEPDTCALPDPVGEAEVQMVRDVATDAVAAAFDAGIRTFVISVGLDIAEEHLQDLANAGVGQGPADADASFYVANDTQTLIEAFNAIVSGLRSCEFPLASPLPAEVAPSCEVTINEQPLSYNDDNGWVRPNDSTLQLQGTACTAIQQGVVSIRLECACDF